MRILFVSASYKPYLGGIERVVEQVCRRLSTQPEVEQVGVLTSYYRYPSELMTGLPAEEAMDGAQIFRTHFMPRRLPFFYHVDMGLFAPGMGRIIRRFAPTHVHYLICDWYLPNLQAYWLTRGRAAQVTTIFDHSFRPSPRTWLFQNVNRWLNRRMDAVHVVSNRAKDVVERTLGAPRERMIVIPLGSEAGDGTAAERRRAKAEAAPFTILCVGRLCAKKGQLELLGCFRNLLGRTSVACRLVLIGDDGGDMESIRSEVKRAGLQDRVLVLGRVPQEELEEWYRKSDVFSLLTRDESFGLVFTEAMASGLPVVAYAVGGVPEALQRGAILLPSGETDAVERALLELVEDDEKRNALSREALAYVSDHLSWDNTVSQLMQVYKRVGDKPVYSRSWENTNESIVN